MPKMKRPLLERLNERVRVDEAGCWVWTGALDSCGYGQISVDGRKRSTHRASYEARVGPIPLDLQIDHLCRNRACMNPAHLEPVTPRENGLRGMSPAAVNARRTHCANGHEFAGENLLVETVDGRSRRVCVACRRENALSFIRRAPRCKQTP